MDYFALRRTKLARPALYRLDADADYHYRYRFNPVPFVALVAGTAMFLTLLDPVALAGSKGFRWLSASGPALVTSGIVHALLTRVWVMPAGKGGYASQAGHEAFSERSGHS